MRKANAELGLRVGMLLALHSHISKVRVCGGLGLYCRIVLIRQWVRLYLMWLELEALHFLQRKTYGWRRFASSRDEGSCDVVLRFFLIYFDYMRVHVDRLRQMWS